MRISFVAAGAVLAVGLVAVPASARSADRLAAVLDAVSAQPMTPGRDDRLGVVAEARRGPETVRLRSGYGRLPGAGSPGPPRDTADHFRIASITKMFVATVVLQLAQEGRLDPGAPAGPGQLDVPLARTPLRGELSALRDWTGRSPGYDEQKITVRDLLQHTGGLREWTNDPWVQTTVVGGPAALLNANRYRGWKWADFARAIEDDPALPRGTFRYANTGYVLLGMLIDRVAGPFRDEVRRRVVVPLGLTETTFPGETPALPTPHSSHYAALSVGRVAGTPFGVHDYTTLNPSALGSAGEGISTTRDLNRFLAALLRGDLLGPALLDAMLTDGLVPMGAGNRYGLGLSVYTLNCADGPPVTLYGHSGAWHGSLSWAFSNRSGDHSLAFNLSMDWAGSRPQERILRAEFSCPAPA